MKKLLTVLLSVLMVFSFTVPAFAADGDDDSPQVVRIPSGTKVVTSDTLNDGVIDRLRVKTIYVPSSVTTIKEGALTGYANVTNVYVENSKDNITIEGGALPAGTNVVYTEKPTSATTTTTTTKPSTTTTTEAESTTKKDSEEKTTKKDDSEEKATTKKTTTKKSDKTTKKSDKTTKKNKSTVSSKATASDPKNRTTVKKPTLSIPSTQKGKTKAGGPMVPEVEVDPDTIEEQPEKKASEEITSVTFTGEAITDKDGTIIGFEDPQTGASDEQKGNLAPKIATGVGVGIVGLSAIALVVAKLRKRP